jgi:PKD domain
MLRALPGETPGPSEHRGIPVGDALAEYAPEVETFGYLTIPRPKGTVAYLPLSWFEGESPFEGCESALFSVDSGITKFFRPPLRGNPDDVNAEDNIATPPGEALVVGVHNGNVVEVQVSPPTTSTTTGAPVEFTAAVVGGGEFSFVWTFGDGTTGEGETVTHAFSGSGTYQVRVTATGTGGDESGGESGPVEVVVGNPPTAEAPGATATTTPQPPTKKPKGAPGKGREGRGGKGSKPAPSGGHKKKKGKAESSARRGGSPTGRSHPDDSAEPSVPPPTSVVPEVPATLPPPAPLPLPEEPSAPTSEGEAPAESVAPTAHTPSPSPPPTAGGELVEGRLVGDDLGPTTLEEAAGGSSEGEGSRSAAGAVGNGGVGVPVGALIVVALLAGGALFEWRRSRPGS